MRPIRTVESTFTYLGPTPEIADLPVRRDDGVVYAVFALTDEERAQIADGAQVEIGIHQEPIPPLSMTIVNQDEAPGQTRDGIPVDPDYRCTRCNGLYVSRRAIALGFKCGWCEGELATSWSSS